MDEALKTRYLGFMKAEAEAPTYDYLRRLTAGHLHTFPFENIGKMHYYLHQGREGLAWMPSPETFLDGFEQGGLGGNCYILNLHFGRLLRALGFGVELVRAEGGNAHWANRVTAEGRAYYVDVGYGAPLFEPLALEEEPRFARYGEEVEVVRLGPDRYRIDRRANGKSFVTKTILWAPAEPEAHADDITHSLRDEDENPFMRRIVATVFTPAAAYTVNDRKLFVKTERAVEVHEYADRENWLAMMRATFGFGDAALEQALRFVGERGNVLF